LLNTRRRKRKKKRGEWLTQKWKKNRQSERGSVWEKREAIGSRAGRKNRLGKESWKKGSPTILTGESDSERKRGSARTFTGENLSNRKRNKNGHSKEMLELFERKGSPDKGEPHPFPKKKNVLR